ncbi:MAG: hypothetical protein U9Q63_01805, partial [Patescibacteria group bacterium]|nr:hypothetical protein [Patescibacteria group bacterium]
MKIKMIKIIRLLLISLFFIFPFGQLTKIPNLPPTVNLYLHDLIIILVLALYFLTKPKIKLNLLKPF